MDRVIRGDGWSVEIRNERIFMRLSGASPELDRQLRFAFRDIALDIPTAVVKGMDDYRPGSRAASDPIMVRTGNLARSVRGFTKGRGASDLQASIVAGSRTVPYAAIQEYGGTITPKRAKALTVPLPHILTDRGDVKGEYALVERGGRHMTRGGKPTWISGRAIMIDDGGTPRPIWALMASVTIEPRLGVGRTIEDHDEWIAGRLMQAFRKAAGPSK